MSSADKLNGKVQFDRPLNSPDGMGGQVQAYEKHLETWCQWVYSRGSETVEAARLEGRAIYKLKLRSSPLSRALTTDHRMQNMRGGEFYQVRELDILSDPAWVYVVVERGVAL